MTKYMAPFAGNQRAQMTAASAVSLSSAATKAFGSCDVINRDPPSKAAAAAAARPTTALPRYMQDTAVSRQRTFFFNRPTPASRLQPPKSARPMLDSENVANQAKGVDSGRWNILRRSLTVVEAGDAAATKEGGLPGDLPPQGPTRTEPLVEISRNLHREVLTVVDAAEGPLVLDKGGIVIEEVTIPLDLSSSAGQSTGGIDQRPLPTGRFGGGGVNVGPIPQGYFLQQTESGIVRLPDISYSSAAAAASGSLRRVSSELPFIGSQSVQRDREPVQEQQEDESRGSSFFSSSSSSPTEDYDPDWRPPAAMDSHRGPSTSGVEGPLKRSMPSTTTLSSGSGHNAVAVDRPRRPSKVQLTDTTDNNSRMVVSGGSTTNRQNDDDVFLPPRTTRQTPTREDRCPPRSPYTNNAARVPVDRRSSMPLTRNKDSAKDTVSPPVSGLSEAALRILDEMNLANDLTRVQNNLERFHRTTRVDQLSTPRLSLGQGQQPVREKKNSWVAAADAGATRQRRPPPAAAAASGHNGLLRTSKSQPNLIRHQRLQQHQHPSQQQQSGVRNPVVNGSRNMMQRRMKPQLRSEDLEDEVDDCDEEDERTETMKRERIVRWLIGANECAEPPPIPTVIEEERPTQTDNAIHIVYNG